MKFTKTIFACAALTALVSSCSNDSEPSLDPNEIRISTSVGGSDILTRATNDATNLQNTEFVNDELINVYLAEHSPQAGETETTYSNPIKYKKVTESNGANMQAESQQQYFPVNGGNVDAWGFYPAKTDDTGYNITEESSTSFTIAENQSDDANYRKSDLMFGTNNPNNEASFAGTAKGNIVPLTFKHKLSKIVVTLADGGGVEANRFDGARINMFGPLPTVTIIPSKSGITLGATSGTAPSSGYNLGTYNASGNAAIIIPQTISQNTDFLKVTLSTENGGKTYIYKLDEDKEFKEGYVYTFNLKLTSGKLEIKTEITNWNRGDSKDGTANIE